MSFQDKATPSDGGKPRRAPTVPVLLLAALLGACAGPGAGLQPIQDTDSTVYHLGAGDQIRLITFGDQELSGTFRLDASGQITVPLLGNIHAGGMTANGLELVVGDKLKAMKLFTKPSVSVEIISYRPIFVLGEVTHPGEYPYQPGMTVLTAAAVAGGFTYRAVEDKFSVVRATAGQKTEGLAKRQTGLQPGDVVSVYERNF
jgi:polysaccharide export outer membrane protein